MPDSSRNSELDQLIQFDRIFSDSDVRALSEQCQHVAWKRSNHGDRFTADVEAPDPLGEAVMEAYCQQLPELFKRMLLGGIQYNGGYTTQAKLSKYVAPSDGYPFHADQWLKLPGTDWRRILTSLTYLNDGYEGGETIFAHGHEILPERGKTLTFPTGWVFSHQGNPVTQGTKYLLVVHVWS